MTPTQRRQNELEWGLARLRRSAERASSQQRSFGVSCSSDGGHTFVRAYPVDISVDGIGLIATEKPKTQTIVVIVELCDQRIQASAQCVTMQQGTLKGNVVWRIGARFIQIAQAARSLIERFVRGSSPNATPERTQGVLPERIVRTILERMVKLGRLAPLRDDLHPLVKMTYAGKIQRRNQILNSFKIESRIVQDGKSTLYITQAYIDDGFTRLEVIPLDNGLAEIIPPTHKRKRPA